MIWNKKKKAEQISQSLRDKGYKIKYSPDGSTYQIVDNNGNPVVVTASTVGMQNAPAYGGISTSGDNEHRRYRKLIGRGVIQSLDAYEEPTPDTTTGSTGGTEKNGGTGKQNNVSNAALKAMEKKLAAMETKNQEYSQQYKDLQAKYNTLAKKQITPETKKTDTEQTVETYLDNLSAEYLRNYSKTKGSVYYYLHPEGGSRTVLSQSELSGGSYDPLENIHNRIPESLAKKFVGASSDDVMYLDYWFDSTPDDEDIRKAVKNGKKYIVLRDRLYRTDELSKAVDVNRVPYMEIPIRQLKDVLPNNNSIFIDTYGGGTVWSIDKGKWKFNGLVKGK